MINRWTELAAARLSADYLDPMVEQYMDAESADQRAAYMEEYAGLPVEVQRALGYMRCLLESSYIDVYTAFGRYSLKRLQRH